MSVTLTEIEMQRLLQGMESIKIEAVRVSKENASLQAENVRLRGAVQEVLDSALAQALERDGTDLEGMGMGRASGKSYLGTRLRALRAALESDGRG